MEKFYIDESNGKLRSAPDLKTAITEMKHFGGLAVLVYVGDEITQIYYQHINGNVYEFKKTKFCNLLGAI